MVATGGLFVLVGRLHETEAEEVAVRPSAIRYPAKTAAVEADTLKAFGTMGAKKTLPKLSTAETAPLREFAFPA